MRTLYHGAAFYPELWPAAVLDEDIAAMRRLGLNVARIGEFAWAKMEPHEGAIDVGFFVEVMTRLHREGIRTIFGTPTATPPVWLTHGHPERLHVDDRGYAMIHGSRQHVCINQRDFRRHAQRIVRAIAEAVGEHPGLLAWQLDNELKCHVSECHCATCAGLWADWLARRFGNIEELNAAWGTDVWSQRYERFDQVPVPRQTAFLHNTALTTAYRLFSYDMVAEFCREQAAIIRQHSRRPITHNGQVGFNFDHDQVFQDLDFAAFDCYPPAGEIREMLFHLDLFRTLRPGRPYWVMETSPSHNGCLTAVTQATPPAGALAAIAVAAYAGGAEGFSYWLWRQQRSGAEMSHGSVLSAWGKPALGYTEAEAVEAARGQLEPILEASEARGAEIALTYSDRARAMWLAEPLGTGRSDGLNYFRELLRWHDRLREGGWARDVAVESAPLEGYKLLITPFVPHLEPAFLARIRAWVEAGGVWIAGPMTHWRTAQHTVPTTAALAELEAFAGVETTLVYPLENTGSVGEAFGVSAPLTRWATFFAPGEAVRRGVVSEGRSPGAVFVTECRRGRGRVVMLGALPEGTAGAAMLQRLIAHYAGVAGCRTPGAKASGLEVFERVNAAGRLWIVANVEARAGSLILPAAAEDVLTRARVEAGELAVPAFGWRVLQLPAGDRA